MGTVESKERLGERVKAARYKLMEDKKLQTERFELMKGISTNITSDIINGIRESLENRSPFSEETLLIAWIADPKQCQKILNDCFKRILQQPIDKNDYQWFKKYMMNSSVLMFEYDKKNKIYIFHDLLNIANKYSEEIILSMNKIYKLITKDESWNDLMKISNENFIERQDDKRVGLLNEETILLFKKINKSKNEEKKDEDEDEKEKKEEELKNFIDSKFATNLLISKAKIINDEYQNHIKIVMSKFGSFQSGPLKVLDRCQSKLENDYFDESFPKTAKLLDLVRCSVTFNTLSQLIAGYNHLINHIKTNSTILQIARIKNGFLDKNLMNIGYRDIKVNILFHSMIHKDLNMICECQLILNQYLWEKKKMHKIYSILRQKVFFELVVGSNVNNKNVNNKNNNDHTLKQIFNLPPNNDQTNKEAYRGCVDSEFKILAINVPYYSRSQIQFYDLKNSRKLELAEYNQFNAYDSYSCFNWIYRNNNKYFAVQVGWSMIKLYKFIKTGIDNISFSNNPIKLESNGEIAFFEFDQNAKHLIVCTNKGIIEIISWDNRNNINVKINRKEIVLGDQLPSNLIKQLAVSNNGNYCIVAGGDYSNSFYLVDLINHKKVKFTSNKLSATYAPCFLNGSDELIAIGGGKGEIEIWDIKKGKVIKSLKSFTKSTFGLHSMNNMLAAASYDKTIKVYDTNNWSVIFTKNTNINIRTLHLSNDAKYLTVSGSDGERCIVFEIQ